MTDSTGLSDIVFRTMPSAYVAAKQTYLTAEDANQINNFAWMTNKHNDLLKLSKPDAVDQFNRLNPQIQKAMKELFDTNYGIEEEKDSKFFSKVKKVVTAPVGGLFEGLRDYTETVISNPFRQADAAIRETGDSWDDTYNGEAYFDRERAAKVEDFYGPVVSKIAKLISSGKRPGEVLLELKTDEEFNAFEAMMNGDDIYDRAISEFDDAKVSYGRRMFGWLQPGAGTHGAQRFLYDRASGIADLGYQIFADPATYATLGVGTGVRLFGKTLVEGTRSLKALLESAEGGIVGSTKLERIFNDKGVNTFWDNLGPIIKDLDSKDSAARVVAINKIKQDFPEIRDDFREVLREAKVFNAVDAKEFFKYSDNVGRAMNGMGLAKIEKTVMPTWKKTRSIKNQMRASTLAFITKDVDAIKEIGTVDNIVNRAKQLGDVETRDYELLAGGAELVKETKKQRGTIGKIERLASRYPITTTINIGDDYAKSSETIFELARTYLPRWHANGVRREFERTDSYGRLLLLKGIYIQMAQSSGLTDTLEGREWLARQLEDQFGGQYATRAYYKPETLAPITDTLSTPVDKVIQAGNFLRPGERAGASFAPQWFQNKPIISNINFAEWQRMANDFESKTKFDPKGSFVGDKFDQANNNWGFFTLFPRNGMRSALEDLIFFGLEASTRDFLSMTKARAISRARRRTLEPTEQTLTAKVGNRIARWSGRYSDESFDEAIKTPEGFAKYQIQNAIDEYNNSPFSKIGRLLLPTGKRLNSEWVDDLYKYGHIQEMGAELTTTGVKSAFKIQRGQSLTSPAGMIDSKYGHAEAVKYNWDMIYSEMGVKPAKAIKQKDGTYRIAKQARPETIQAPSPEDTFGIRPFVASWHGSLLYEIDADRVGAAIILDNLNNPAVAVDRLVRHYRQSKSIDKALQGSVAYNEIAKVEGAQSALRKMASNHFLIFRNLVTDGRDEPIEELINAIFVRQAKDSTEAFSKISKFYPEDLINITRTTRRAPSEIHGYQYILADEDPGNVASKLAMLEEKGYNFMQRQVDMTAREPIFLARYLANREQLSKAELKDMQRLVASGYSEDIAKAIASEKFSNIASKNAMERTIAYIDNPNVRSTLAFNARNFARFYRATEDFYRRSARLGINNPDVLIRLRLSLVGLDAAGFIHKDEEGEDYFIYPADDIIYGAVNQFSTLLGRQPALEVMPVEFTSKISMFTPSLDPDSGLPALNGPVSALPVSAIRYIMGKTDMLPGEIEAGFNRYTMGVYSENSTLLDMLVPSTFRKGLNILSSINQEEGNKQVQSAFYAATAYAASAGLAPLESDDFDALKRKQAQLLVTAANVITIRNIIGFFAPASIQMEEIKDLPDYVLRTGTTKLSSEYYTIVNGLKEKGSEDPWGEALAIFTKKNPGRLAYTIPRTENEGLIKINKTKDAANWVRENGKFIKKYGSTGVLFAPQIGEFDINAYSFLKLQGFTKNRDLEDFLIEMETKKSRRDYDEIRNKYDELIASTPIESIKSSYRAKASQVLGAFRNANPLLAEQLASYEFNTYEQQTGIDELRAMLDAGDAPDLQLARKLSLMLKVYDSARSVWAIGTGGEQLSPQKVREIRQDSIAQLERIAGNDPALNLAIDKLFAPVLERSR